VVAAAGLGIGLSAGPTPTSTAASLTTGASHVSAVDHARQVASPGSHSSAATIPGQAAPQTIPASASGHASVTLHPAAPSHSAAPTLQPTVPSHSATPSHSASASSSANTAAVHAAGAAHPATATASAPAPAPPAKPYQIYDSVTPTEIPAHQIVATYATGPFAVPASQVAGRHVMWIDTNGTDPNAQALDVEPGDATPPIAASWVSQKLTANPHAIAILYTMRSEWPAVQSAVGTLPSWMQHQVRWWIADPTGYPHVVPGSNATQWYWGQNYDISTANPGF
jgi:hypothetical protein